MQERVQGEIVRATHQTIDATAAAVVQTLYDNSIDFGGHPNERGVASSLRLDKSQPDAVTLISALSHPSDAPIYPLA